MASASDREELEFLWETGNDPPGWPESESAGRTEDEHLLSRMAAFGKIRSLRRQFANSERRPYQQETPLEEGETGGGSTPQEWERFHGYSNASERSQTERAHLRTSMARTVMEGDDPGDPGGGPPSRCP